MRWTATAVLSLTALLAWHHDARGSSCAAQGSFSIAPTLGTTCPTALEVGDVVDFAVTATNASSSVPPGTAVAARLVNTCLAGNNNGSVCALPSNCESGTCGPALVYTLACAQSFCLDELPGVLTFVAVGSNGCVTNVPDVVSCAVSATNPNQVEIVVDADGVPLAAGATAVPIATIRAMVTSAIPFAMANACGRFHARVAAAGQGIHTDDPQCDPQGSNGIDGITELFAPEPSPSPTPSCPVAPQTGCRQPIVARVSRVELLDETPDTRDRLEWRWTRGAATAKSDFGDPLTTTGYRLCIYDELTSSVTLAAAIPGGTCGTRSCWKATTRGFKYANRIAGVIRLDLRGGAEGKATVSLEAHGTDVGLPTLPLSEDTAVTIQLQNDAGECWEARYTAPFNGNHVDGFRDRSD